ncbi:MAG TPA: hypothetical protein VGA40_03140 [Candidatus Acidoferrales bacterium]
MANHARVIVPAALALAVLLAAAPARAQREPRVPPELIERVGEWAERYLASFPAYAAEETLVQTRWDRSRRESSRRIISVYMVMRLADNPRELAEFRDVVAVDEKIFQSPEERIAKWEKIAAARTRSEITALVEDPGRHRFSSDWFASLGLLVSRVATRHHSKMRYFFPADVSEVVTRNVLIGYRQNDGTGLMEIDGRAIYPMGTAWVEPDDGHVVRIEEEFEHKGKRYHIAVDFVESDEVGALTPGHIVVRFFERGRLTLQNSYTYSKFRPLGNAASSVAVP